MRRARARTNERHHCHLKEFLRSFGRLMLERGHTRARLDDLIDLAAERLRDVAKLQIHASIARPTEEHPGSLVRMLDDQVATDDNARAAELAQDVGHHFVIAEQLIVKPDVLHRQAKLFEQMKNQFELAVANRLSSDAPIEGRDADQLLVIEHRDRDLRSKDFEFLLHLRISKGFSTVPPHDPSLAMKIAANASVERKLKVLQQTRRQTQCARGPHALRPDRRSIARGRSGLTQKQGGAVYAKDGAELK